MTADDPVLGRVADTTRVSPEMDELVEEFATVCYEVGWQHAKGTPPDIAEASREEIRTRLESQISTQRAEIERLQRDSGAMREVVRCAEKLWDSNGAQKWIPAEYSDLQTALIACRRASLSDTSEETNA